MDNHHDTLRHLLDGISLSAAAGAVMGWLPPISAVLSIVWLSIQIGEWAIRKVKGK